MAGTNHRIIGKGSRDNPAAVGISFFLFLLVLLVQDAHSQYIISVPDGDISTKSYWIQEDKLYLFEDGEPVQLSDIASIKQEPLSVLEEQMRKDALKRFHQFAAWLLMVEDEVMMKQNRNFEVLKAIEDLRQSGKSKSKARKAVKILVAELDNLEREITTLRTYWGRARIPEDSLVSARDIKSLQLLGMRSSVQQMSRYVKTWDPTYREYAKELIKQVQSFEISFHDALKQK